MNVSPGIDKVRKTIGNTRSISGGSWDMLYYIKKKYPGLVGGKLRVNEKNPMTGEQIVLDTLS